MAKNLENLQGEIRHQLKVLGYHNIEMVRKYERGFDFIADGALRNIFLSVMVILTDHFSKLTDTQIEYIKSKADELNKEPWSAVMSVNSDGQLVHKIQWTNLAKATV